MTMTIRYHSRTGNTKKPADVISQAVGIAAEPVDILFLCSAVYGAGVNGKVKRVVNISTAAILSSTYSQIAKRLALKNIILDERTFHCCGNLQ